MNVDNTKNEKNNIIIYNKESSLMNMISVPYFGVYSNNYTFFLPINVLHSNKINKNIFDSFPTLLKNNFLEINNNNNIIEFDYFVTTLDGSYLNSKYTNNTHNGFLRVNFVPHPYVFYDVKDLNKDHISIIFSGMFTENNYKNYIKETNENDGLRINAEKLICDANKKEIILHKSNDNFPALSPNNCAVLINMDSAYFSVFNMTLVTYGNKIVKCMISQYNFINNSSVLLIEPFVNAVNSNNLINNSPEEFLNYLILFKEITISALQNIFIYFSDKLNFIEYDSSIDLKKTIIKKIFNFIYLCNENSNELINNLALHEENFNDDNFNDLINISEIRSKNEKSVDFSYNDLCSFIWYNLGRPSIDNIGETFLYSNVMLSVSDLNIIKMETKNMFTIEIIQKYLRFKITNIEKIINSYILIIKETNSIPDNYKEEKIDKDKIFKLNLENEKRKNIFKFLDNLIRTFYSEIIKDSCNNNNLNYEDFINEITKLKRQYIKQINPVIHLLREALEEAFNVKYILIKFSFPI